MATGRAAYGTDQAGSFWLLSAGQNPEGSRPDQSGIVGAGKRRAKSSRPELRLQLPAHGDFNSAIQLSSLFSTVVGNRVGHTEPIGDESVIGYAEIRREISSDVFSPLPREPSVVFFSARIVRIARDHGERVGISLQELPILFELAVEL